MCPSTPPITGRKKSDTILASQHEPMHTRINVLQAPPGNRGEPGGTGESGEAQARSRDSVLLPLLPTLQARSIHADAPPDLVPSDRRFHDGFIGRGGALIPRTPLCLEERGGRRRLTAWRRWHRDLLQSVDHEVARLLHKCRDVGGGHTSGRNRREH